jgi:5'-3' exonuclease
MGIPSYFNWLVRHFEEEIIANKCPYEVIHQLYLDFNAGIHPAVRSHPDQSIDQMIASVIKYLEYLIEIVQPTELLYIAIDGVAPTAKMKQQRLRRFKSIKETNDLNILKQKYNQKINDHTQKDFNMISPATLFMDNLSKQIQIFLQHQKNERYKHLKIVLSDASVPGEGEHKILKEIKTQPKDKKMVIYGLDSDLIMLSLSTDRQNLLLLRENTLINDNQLDLITEKYPQMTYFIVSGLRDKIVKIMNPYTSLGELEGIGLFSTNKKDQKNQTNDHSKSNDSQASYLLMQKEHFFQKEAEQYNLVRDYIFISFFLGNDFVPSFEALKIREGGIEQILRAYKIVIQKKRKYLLTNNFEINQEFFSEFLMVLSKIELNLLKKQKKNRDNRLKLQSSNYSPSNYQQALQEYQSVEGLFKDQINVFENGWQNRYYQYFFHLQKSENFHKISQIEKICQDYINALHWITRYYFVGCSDWYWFYQHDATPLLSDLNFYLNNHCDLINQVKMNNNHPIRPFHQLLTILPPQSIDLLPHAFHYLMQNDFSPIIHYYPLEFELEYYGKRYRWECHPKIPMIHPIELTKHLISIDSKLTQQEKERNEFKQQIEF